MSMAWQQWEHAMACGQPRYSRSLGQAHSEPPSRCSWGLQALEIEALWGRGLTGAGVLVGDLDTGVSGDHPALAGRLEAFIEFDEVGAPIPGQQARDRAGHGTHTAGIICGGNIDGQAIGVAPGA